MGEYAEILSGFSDIILEANKDPLIVVNSSSKITAVNTAAEEFIGLKKLELLGTDFFLYFTDLTQSKREFKDLYEQGSKADMPFKLESKNGRSENIFFNGAVYLASDGTQKGIVLTGRKVTTESLVTENAIGFIDSLPDALIITSTTGEIQLINHQAELLFGYEKKELQGRNLEVLIPDNLREIHKKHVKKYSLNPKIRMMGEGLPLMGVHKSGKEFPVEVGLNHFSTPYGSFVTAAVRDVTAQMAASQYARSLIEASLDPLLTINIDGKITDVNEASIQITGIERNDLIGTDFCDYFTEPEKARKGYLQVFEKGFVSDFPLTIKHINGTFSHVLYNASVYKDRDGNVLGIFAAARDITKQKQSSHYARSLIEASLDPLVTIGIDGKIMDINEAMVKATDRTRLQLIGTNFNSYFVERESAHNVYKTVFMDGFVRNFPLTIIDGILTDVLLNGSVFRNEEGEIIGAVIIARDITELKRIEKELIESKIAAELAANLAEDAQLKAENSTRMAEDAVKAKQQFLSNMSHEIRTPMNAIIGFTKVVLKTELSVKQKEYLTAIKMSGDALIVLINDILDLAKVDSGKMVFEKTPFKMSQSIESMLQLFETKIQEKNLTLITEYDPNIPIIIIGDPVRLHQIILNLVSNAVKFTSKGSITVCVKVITQTPDKIKLSFSVADTGIGISPNNLEKIFDNFQQASSGTSRLYGGTGLGLAIVKQLVEIQGGTVMVNSVLGQGSTFGFIMDFQISTQQVLPELNIDEFENINGSISVLVVEDIQLNQLLMKTLLDDFGFERDIASNGKIAIEKLKTKNYDIVLMDLQMPEMNGFEATEYIRNVLQSKIPIIALTADVTTSDLQKCKDVGMDDYISKPVDEKVLYRKIVDLVRYRDVESLKNNIRITENMIPEKVYINLDYLNKITKSDPVLIRELIFLYLEQTPVLIETMKLSIANLDWESLHSAVHKILPSFAIMGMNTDYENMARKILEFSNNPQDSNGIEEMVAELELVCDKACKELIIELEVMPKFKT